MLWLILGDNLTTLRALGSLVGSVTLAYLDPPFFTNRLFKTAEGRPAFDDRWETLSEYLQHLRARFEALKPLLATHGSVVVHVDSKTSHYVKVMGDEIFGYAAFASEIVWRYRRWPSRTLNFQHVHDVLLRWVADPTKLPRFVQQYEPLAPSTRKKWGESKQVAVFDRTGRRRISMKQSEPSPGVPLGDVWEIPVIAPIARERTGYPTQKPEALLVRLIQSCSHPGDIVLDPYSGSGTTMVAAAKLHRQAIGIDSSLTAIETTRRRLTDANFPFEETAMANGDLVCPMGPTT